MRISDALTILKSIIEYNITEATKKASGTSAFVVPFLISDPGVGKTSIIRQAAAYYNLRYYQVIVAQYDPGELAGLPFVSEDKKTMTRLRPNYLPPVDGGGGVFNLDELPQAMLAAQNVCSQLVNEWRVGEHVLDRTITITATGNKPENKAGTTTMPTHLRDRLMFLPVEVDHEDFLVYATGAGIDPRIRVFIKQHPKALAKFEPAANACPSPRSWEKVNAVLAMEGLSKHQRKAALDGTVGPAAATEFEAWLRVEERIPKIEDIVANPLTTPVFTNRDADVLYLVLSSLADNFKDTNGEAIVKYVERTPNKEFIAYWLTELRRRDKSLMQNKYILPMMLNVGNKLVA